MKELRADWSKGMLAIVWCGVLCLPFCYAKIGPMRDEVIGEQRKLHNRSFMICTPHQILFKWSNEEKWAGWGMWHVWETGEELLKVCCDFPVAQLGANPQTNCVFKPMLFGSFYYSVTWSAMKSSLNVQKGSKCNLLFFHFLLYIWNYMVQRSFSGLPWFVDKLLLM